MEQLLAYTCSELDCYLDELKSKRRGDTSTKRRVATLVLLKAGANFSQIAYLLHKNQSSLREAEKNASIGEKILAEKIILNFFTWKYGRLN